MAAEEKSGRVLDFDFGQARGRKGRAKTRLLSAAAEKINTEAATV